MEGLGSSTRAVWMQERSPAASFWASHCNWDYLTRFAMNILVKDISRAATKRYLPICPSGYLSVYPHLSIYPSIHLSIYPSIHLSIHPCIFPPTLLSIYACIHPSVYCPGNSLKKKLVRGFEIGPSHSHVDLPLLGLLGLLDLCRLLGR